MKTISKAEWKSYHRHGYTSVTNGQRYILSLNKATQATMLEPVEVTGLAPARQGWAATDFDELHSAMSGRKAAAAYRAGSSLG